MKALSRVLLMAAAALCLTASPALAAPSATGAVAGCPTRCAILGPVTGSGLLPQFNQLHFYANWVVLSTSDPTPSLVNYFVEVNTLGSGDANNYAGSGTTYLYAYNYTDPSSNNNDYRILNVTAKMTLGVAQVDSVGGLATFHMLAATIPTTTQFAGLATLTQGF